MPRGLPTLLNEYGFRLSGRSAGHSFQRGSVLKRNNIVLMLRYRVTTAWRYVDDLLLNKELALKREMGRNEA
ncbi:MAG: hypothetical protein U1F34_02160 [Gammaproteobacteria bacterium]